MTKECRDITDLDLEGFENDEEKIAPLPGEVEENRKATRIRIASSGISYFNCVRTFNDFNSLAAVTNACDERIGIHILMDCASTADLAKESKKFAGKVILEAINRLYGARESFDNRDRAALNALSELKKKGYGKEKLIEITKEYFGLSEKEGKEILEKQETRNRSGDADIFFSIDNEPVEHELGLDREELLAGLDIQKRKEKNPSRISPKYLTGIKESLKLKNEGKTPKERARILGITLPVIKSHDYKFRLDEEGEVKFRS